MDCLYRVICGDYYKSQNWNRARRLPKERRCSVCADAGGWGEALGMKLAIDNNGPSALSLRKKLGIFRPFLAAERERAWRTQRWAHARNKGVDTAPNLPLGAAPKRL
jgi:hypothetical protein